MSAALDSLPDLPGNGFHAPISGMSGDAFMFKLPFGAGVILFILVETFEVDELATDGGAGFSQNVILDRAFPEAAPHDDGRSARMVEGFEEIVTGFAEGLLVGVGFWGSDIFTDRQNDQIRLKLKSRFQAFGNVERRIFAFEIGDIPDVRLGLSFYGLLDLLQEQV